MKDYVRWYGKEGISKLRDKLDVARDAKEGEEFDDPFEKK